jgi:hypothetical protein
MGAVDGLCCSITSEFDKVVESAVEDVVFERFQCLPSIEEIRNLICVGFGYGHDTSPVLFRNVVFFNGDPVVEIDVKEIGGCLGIERRPVEEGFYYYFDGDKVGMLRLVLDENNILMAHERGKCIGRADSIGLRLSKKRIGSYGEFYGGFSFGDLEVILEDF